MFFQKSNNNKLLIKGVTQVITGDFTNRFDLSINYKGLISISNAHSQVGNGLKKRQKKIFRN
jgi:hypothetical protein